MLMDRRQAEAAVVVVVVVVGEQAFEFPLPRWVEEVATAAVVDRPLLLHFRRSPPVAASLRPRLPRLVSLRQPR
jgi:hypothetical protein